MKQKITHQTLSATTPISTQNNLSKSAVRMVTINADRQGQRLDNYLLSELKRVPKSLIYRIIRKGEVRVNKGRIKPDYKLQLHDVVRIPPVALPTISAPQPIGCDFAQLLRAAVLYESDGLFIVNKPAGLAVHGGSGVNIGFIESLQQAFSQYPYLELVHRLDRGTSGCLMVAKKRSTLRALHQQLRQRGQIIKQYHALVAGSWPESIKQIDLPLFKYQLPSGERRVKVHKEGKVSMTKSLVLQSFADYTLLQMQAVTGRTHQLRVHCQAQGHAIVGDEKYGDEHINRQAANMGFKRMFLHAARLRLTDPSTSQMIEVEAPYDQAMNYFFRRISNG